MSGMLSLVEVPEGPCPAQGWTTRKCMLVHCENGIKQSLVNVNQSFLHIGMYLHDIQERGLYNLTNVVMPDGFIRACNSVIEYAVQTFDMSPSTVSNLIRVYETFADDGGVLFDKWKDYTFSQLCELLRFPYIDSSIDSIVSPSMTCRQIRALNPKNKAKENKTQEIFAPRFDVKNEVLPDQISIEDSENHSDVGIAEELKPHEPQDTSGIVYLHFANIEELRDWYFSDKWKNVSFPLTISYHVSK